MVTLLWVCTTIYSSADLLAFAFRKGEEVYQKLRLADACMVVVMGSIFLLAYSLIIYGTVVRWKSPHLESSRSNKTARITNIVIIVTCVLVAITFLISFLPYAISYLINSSEVFHDYRIHLIYLNSMLDPLVYFFKRYLRIYLSRRDAMKRSREKQTTKHCNATTETTAL